MKDPGPDTGNGRNDVITVLLATYHSQTVVAEHTGTLNRIACDLYGVQSAEQPPQSRQGFNGELRETLLEGYALGAGYRVYSPLLRRFHAMDELSPFGAGGLNGYGYCKGDPLNNNDPSGGIPLFLPNGFRRMLQNTRALWRSNGGTISTVSRHMSSEASAQARMFSMASAGGTVETQALSMPKVFVEPSPTLYRVSAIAPSSVKSFSQPPGERLATPMQNMRTDRAWVTPSGRNQRLWISSDGWSAAHRPDPLTRVEWKSSQRLPFSAKLVRYVDKNVQQHRDSSSRPLWEEMNDPVTSIRSAKS